MIRGGLARFARCELLAVGAGRGLRQSALAYGVGLPKD